jgi:hypothetical protein
MMRTLLALFMVPLAPLFDMADRLPLPVNHETGHEVPYESVNESERLFDDERARTIKGVIADKRTVVLEDGVRFVQVDVKTDAGLVPVHLAPQWFLEYRKGELDLDRGRSVSVWGSSHQVMGREVFVAAEVSNPDREQRLRLRHPSGVPAWVGSERTP